MQSQFDGDDRGHLSVFDACDKIVVPWSFLCVRKFRFLHEQFVTAKYAHDVVWTSKQRRVFTEN